MALFSRGKRPVVVSGVRTPFVKAGSAFKDYTFQALGAHVLKALVKRTALDPNEIDEFVFSTVLLDPRTPNWAREIIFQAGLPKTIFAHSVSNNCISGLEAVTAVAERISLGITNCGIAGGSESMSNPTLLYHPRGSKLFLELARARSVADRIPLLLKLLAPAHFLPKAPSVTEPSTGLTMGEHMEITAKEFGITRQAQDEIALNSHLNAWAATADGRLTAEIEALEGVDRDLIIRKETSLEKLSKLKPAFDRSGKGTLTAGNSSALTDGASAVLLMSEARAQEQGRKALAYISDYEYSAISPDDGLLMAPAVAVPRLLKRNGLTLNDFDLIEVHEAFGAQVLANIKAWEEGWKEPAVGKLDRAKLNTLGGSVAIGHPFAATGGRMVTTLANEMQRKSLKRGLISVCAAGAMACALILERD